MNIFNQYLKPYTKMWCPWYTYLWILSDHYWLNFNNEEVIQLLEKEEAAGFWDKALWAYFSPFYNFATDLINNRYWLNLKIDTVDINSLRFEQLPKSWKTFWLWMRKANRIYVDLSKDWIISLDDILKLENSKDTGHNHRILYKEWKYYIIESLNFVDNTIEITLEALKEAVRLWIYYSTARTILEWNIKTKYVWTCLRTFRDYPDQDIKGTEQENEWRDIAGTIYLTYQAGRSIN